MSNSVLMDKDENILNPIIPRYERITLWVNDNPSQEMAGNVTINLSNDSYDELEWIFAYSTTANNSVSVNCLKGQNVHVISMGYNNPTLIRRTISYVSDTQYKTDTAKFGDTDSNTALIPIKVIGIKNS